MVDGRCGCWVVMVMEEYWVCEYGGICGCVSGEEEIVDVEGGRGERLKRCVGAGLG